MKVAKRIATTAALSVWLLLLGATFTRAETAVSTLLNRPTFSVAVIPAPAPAVGSIIFAGCQGDTNFWGTVRSTDGGATWDNMLAATAYSLAADPGTPGTVYAATGPGLYRTSDYGDTWVLVDATSTTSVIVNPADSLIIYSDNRRSTDGGATWNPMAGLPMAHDPYDMPHIKVSPALPSILYAVVDTYLFRSFDYGATWAFWWRPWDEIDSVEVDPVDGRTVYLGAACGGESYRVTLDEIGNVTGIDEMSIRKHVHGFAVDPAANNIVYAVNEREGLQRSFDFGTTWCSIGITWYDVAEGRMVYDSTGDRLYVPIRYGNGGLQVFNPSLVTDSDCDGYSVEGYFGPSDCDDSNWSIHPGAGEVARDGIDQNCDGIDLSILITKATCGVKKGLLEVEADSLLGADAALDVVGYGPMNWNPSQLRWDLVIRKMDYCPGSIRVCGAEGCTFGYVFREDFPQE